MAPATSLRPQPGTGALRAPLPAAFGADTVAGSAERLAASMGREPAVRDRSDLVDEVSKGAAPRNGSTARRALLLSMQLGRAGGNLPRARRAAPFVHASVSPSQASDARSGDDSSAQSPFA